jgi:hypothetical protein
MSDYRAKVSYKPPINIPLGARREVLRLSDWALPPENVHDRRQDGVRTSIPILELAKKVLF